MHSRFLIFISVLASVLGMAAFYVGVRVVTWSQWASDHSAWVWGSLAMAIGLQFLAPTLYRALPNHLNRLFFLHWVTYTALGVFACMFFYIFAADIVAWVATGLFHAGDVTGIQSLVAGVLILGTVVIGSVQVAIGPRVYEVDVPLRDLPAAFDGFRIVQITDLHLGPTIGERYARQVVRIANRLEADVVALTGDFIDGSVAQLKAAAAPLAELKSKMGTFFITGNHEYYWGVQSWVDEFRRLGAHTLLNEHVVLRREGSEIVLAGVTDRSGGGMSPAHYSDPVKAIAGAPSDAIKILLAHHPKSYLAAARAGFHLQLSGHTHGGQFFPFTILVRLAERFYKGLYRVEGLWLYVSRGTGYWGPPLRFGVPAEITVLTLRRAATA